MNNAMKVGKRVGSAPRSKQTLPSLRVFTSAFSLTTSTERRCADGAAAQGQLLGHGEPVDHLRRLHQLREDEGASGDKVRGRGGNSVPEEADMNIDFSGGAGEGEGEEGGRAGQGERLQRPHSPGREEDRPERGAQQEALEGRKGRARSSLCPSMSFYQE